MEHVYYETHRHPDAQFPVIFRFDTVRTTKGIGHLHWHEALEFLYCVEGEGIIISNEEKIAIAPGQMVVINANNLHTVYTEKGLCQYYCLIPSNTLFEGTGLPIGEIVLSSYVQNHDALIIFPKIINEMREQGPYYRLAVRSLITAMYVALYRRNGCESQSKQLAAAKPVKSELVKRVIDYLGEHYTEDITMEQLCQKTGYSKYYLCHTFREVTGQTILNYTNFLRCNHARCLLNSGEYNVGESAWRSGFHSFSYFSRTYRKMIGELPSEQKGCHRQHREIEL